MQSINGSIWLLRTAGSLALGLIAVLPSYAADANYQQALADFQAKKYSSALTGFQKVASSNRADVLSHYYMALCYQNTNQMGLAAREYQWVATYSKDPALKTKAGAGAAQLSRYQTSRADNRILQTQTTSATPAAGSKSQYSRGRLKVMEFYTSWCKVCKMFEPNFQAAQSQYGNRCDFQKLDAEDPSNRSLVEKYGISGYPTTVFTDSSGKMINVYAGATSADGLGAMIEGCLVQLPY